MLIFLQNRMTQEQILPISLQSFMFTSSLLQVLKMLKDFVYKYKCKKEIFDLQKGILIITVWTLAKIPFL